MPDGATTPQADSRGDFHAAWVVELDRLELDVALAERMLRAGELESLPKWTEPQMRAPLPEDLVPRARLILEKQLAVAHALTQRAAQNAKQYALTERLRDSVPPDIPVYVDVTA